MKTIYTYHTKEEISSSQKILILEIGDEGISVINSEKKTNKPVSIHTFEFDKDQDITSNLQKCTDAILQAGKLANQVSIFYNYKDSVLIPQKYHQTTNNSAFLDLMFAQTEDATILEDSITSLNMVNIYRIPEQIHHWFKLQFPQASFSHSTSKQIVASTTDNELKVIFSFGTMKVLYFNAGNLQLVQYFKYRTPEDVLYHLLSICEAHHINPSEIYLHLKGLIEASSAIYRTLYEYFLNIHLHQGTKSIDLNDNEDAASIHYFSHLFELTT